VISPQHHVTPEANSLLVFLSVFSFFQQLNVIARKATSFHKLLFLLDIIIISTFESETFSDVNLPSYLLMFLIYWPFNAITSLHCFAIAVISVPQYIAFNCPVSERFFMLIIHFL